jgi:hypothetical protein
MIIDVTVSDFKYFSFLYVFLLFLFAFVFFCMYVCIRMFVCMYVCMYACMALHACMHACMYVCMCAQALRKMGVGNNDPLSNAMNDRPHLTAALMEIDRDYPNASWELAPPDSEARRSKISVYYPPVQDQEIGSAKGLSAAFDGCAVFV